MKLTSEHRLHMYSSVYSVYNTAVLGDTLVPLVTHSSGLIHHYAEGIDYINRINICCDYDAGQEATIGVNT